MTPWTCLALSRFVDRLYCQLELALAMACCLGQRKRATRYAVPLLTEQGGTCEVSPIQHAPASCMHALGARRPLWGFACWNASAISPPGARKAVDGATDAANALRMTRLRVSSPSLACWIGVGE